MTDKNNLPTLIFKEKLHFPGHATFDEEIRFFIYLIEEGIQLCKENNVEKFNVIYDAEGNTFKNNDFTLIYKLM